ncbi:MAG: hypothetical protein LBK95_20910 [Bifidobacteriaceae bacterium]|jgi:hypothetical protein|nr:hypothetical protein [Bifidobacteriaceae bacterium]
MKQMTRQAGGIEINAGWVPPAPLAFVLAYQGPASMRTVVDWMRNSDTEHKLEQPNWTPKTRLRTPMLAFDGVFVLGIGSLKANNTPLTPETVASVMNYFYTEDGGALLMLFLTLQQACRCLSWSSWSLIPYAQSVDLKTGGGYGVSHQHIASQILKLPPKKRDQIVRALTTTAPSKPVGPPDGAAGKLDGGDSK